MTDDNEHHEEVKPTDSDWSAIPPLGTPHNPAPDPEFTLPEDQRPPDAPGVPSPDGAPELDVAPVVDRNPRSRRGAA